MRDKSKIPPEMTLDEGKNHPIDPDDQSLFGTRRPRPMGVGRHLMVVLLCFLAALGLAVYYAEVPIEGPDAPADKATSPQP